MPLNTFDLIFLTITIIFLIVNTKLFLITLKLRSISNYLLNIIFFLQQFAFLRILFINSLGNYYGYRFSFESYAGSGLFFAIPILFYLYTRSVINDEKKLFYKDRYHLLLFLILYFIFNLPIKSIYSQDYGGNADLYYWSLFFNNRVHIIIHVIRILVTLGYASATYLMLNRYFKNKTKSIQINSVKKWLYFLLYSKAVLLVLNILFTIIFKGYSVDLETAMYASKIIIALLFLGTAIYLYSNKNIMYNIPDYLKPQNKKNNKAKIDIAHIFKMVNETVIKAQLFTQKDFNLINLSVKTGIKPKELTLTISENGFTNFSAYANHFKVEKSKALMEIGFLENYSIEALAEKSGFGASNSFYRIFKNATGITPNQYAKRLKTEGESKILS